MRLWGLIALVGALAGCASQPVLQDAAHPAARGLQQAWVQAVAGPAWAVRALTTDATCPSLAWPGGSLPMTERSAPGDEPPPPGNREPEHKPTHFTLRACEATWPMGVARLQVDQVTLQAPAAEVRRIVVIGDTGCRLKASGHAYQGCSNPADWPFPQVLAQALAMKPDLVLHVGDYHYRESPCPAALTACANSPWGYGDDTWQADFFQPAQALLAAAPWVFARGNHEACSRAGQGWLRYLDPQTGPARACEPAGSAVNSADFTTPYAVPLSALRQLIIFDSSEVGSRTPPKDSPAWSRWRAQLDRVAELAGDRTHSLFVSHHPSLAFDAKLNGTPATARSGLTPLLQEANPGRLFPPGVETTLHGHVHIHQALGFSSDHPATLVVGNSGSAAEGRINTEAASKYTLQPGARLETVEIHAEFGFSLLTSTPEGWLLDAFDASGHPLARCSLSGARLRC